MSRLDTIRTYFIERFFALLTGDLEFVGLSEPAELFNAGGTFNVPANSSGFIRIPTLAALQKRSAGASSQTQKDGLERFANVLRRTLTKLFGSLASVDIGTGARWANQVAPVIRHPDMQTYWPVDIGCYLSFEDGTLRARYYDKEGEQSLPGQLFSVMFENPDVWPALDLPPKPPFEARVPFVATIGINGNVPPFPASPLTAGHLNLSAADARLTPALLQPTIFAEMKSIPTALGVNQHYAITAASGGRFSALRHNRIQADPSRATAPALPLESDFTAPGLPFRMEPLMLLFHGFYPADDGARRTGNGTGTNREFHHLAVGLLLPAGMSEYGHIALEKNGLLFVSFSPTEAQVLPLSHPSLRFVDDTGQESANGSHPIIFANTLVIQGLTPSGDNVDKDRLAENGKEALDYNPDDWQWWAGLGSFTAAGALVGFAAGGPVGVAIGAGVALVVFALAWLLKKLFGGSKDRTKEWTEQEGPWGNNGTSIQSYQQGSSHDIGPPGTTSETGGAKPGQSYQLKMIPHFPDDNLYGLAFAGGDTFRIIDDAGHEEMLAWHAFEGGIGYQFDRPLPGRTECAGTSIQNYFDLFLQKYDDLKKAQAEVVYFESQEPRPIPGQGERSQGPIPRQGERSQAGIK